MTRKEINRMRAEHGLEPIGFFRSHFAPIKHRLICRFGPLFGRPTIQGIRFRQGVNLEKCRGLIFKDCEILPPDDDTPFIEIETI